MMATPRPWRMPFATRGTSGGTRACCSSTGPVRSPRTSSARTCLGKDAGLSELDADSAGQLFQEPGMIFKFLPTQLRDGGPPAFGLRFVAEALIARQTG